MFRPDPDQHFAAARSAPQRRAGEAAIRLPAIAICRPALATSAPSTKFMAGLPTKPATKVLTGS